MKIQSHPARHIPLTHEDHAHLQNLGSGLMRLTTPDHIASDFIQKGFACHAVGGLMITDMGKEALIKGPNA